MFTVYSKSGLSCFLSPFFFFFLNLKVKGQPRRVDQIVSVTAVAAVCCLTVGLEKMGKSRFRLHQGYCGIREELQLYLTVTDKSILEKNYSCRRREMCQAPIWKYSEAFI